jgi:hypothetical protein
MASNSDNGIIAMLSSRSFERTVARLEEELRANGKTPQKILHYARGVVLTCIRTH